MDKSIEFAERLSLQKLIPLLLISTVFALPISSSGKSIFLALSVLCILLTPSYRYSVIAIIQKPWCVTALMLFGLAILASLWSPASIKEKLFVIEKYSKLLYLPVLVVGFSQARVRYYALHAFMFAMLITCVIAILKFHDLLPLAINPEHVFRNRIMTGFMVAFASYLSVWMIYQQPRNKYVFGYLLLTVIFTYDVLLVNGSRTGYVVYLLLMTLLVLQLCTWKQAIAGLLLVSSIFLISYWQSTEMRQRINSIHQQVHNYKRNQTDNGASIGLRLKYHDFAQKLFFMHPFVGNGTASFTYDFRTMDPIPTWGNHLLEPHSQYWLVATEFGLIGLLILGAFFYTLFRASWNLQSMRVIALGLLTFFLMGNLSDSLLFYSGSGYFFLLFIAICLGEQVNQKET